MFQDFLMFHPHHFEASFFSVHVSTAWLVAQERRQNDRANDYAHHDAQLRHVGKLQAKILQTNGCCSSLHGNKWSEEQQLKKVTRENWPSNILAMACNGRENPFQTHVAAKESNKPLRWCLGRAAKCQKTSLQFGVGE